MAEKQLIGQKHLIECNCILPQYKNRSNPVFHKFIVFSIIDENDNVIPKIVECPFCGIIHRIKEIGVSEITTKEFSSSVRKVEEIKASMPANIVGILESNNCDLPTWENVEFLYENELWGQYAVISSEKMDENTHGKLLYLKGPTLIKIEAFSREDIIR